jgi:hypothetical protein
VDFVSGNIYVRTQDALSKGMTVVGHCHNFGHTTYVNRGSFEISLLKDVELNPQGRVVGFNREKTRIIKSTDACNWAFIAAGRYHMLMSLEDDSGYHCIYSHRFPQALTHPPGQIPEEYTKRDEQGNLWLKVDERIVQEHTGWEDAYR